MEVKRAKVHMLPTNGKDIALLSKRVKDGMLQSANGTEGVANCNTMWQPQHLYFTTDEEIKDGDWFINTNFQKIYQANSENSKNIIEFGPHPEIRKIIATTDPELILEKVGTPQHGSHDHVYCLPQIPQDFIKAYCEKGGIDEVDVEYLPKLEKGTDLGYECIYIVPDKPKLNQDGTLAVSLVEEKMYTLKDIERAFHAGHQWATGDGKPIHSFKEWVKENL